ncbi:MAG TPA: hypothetical protein VN980_15925, partial [Alphaproteobacteria bacterium]|nr:hypothetical protein [Alphaproteobacteria bacterium]
DGICRAEFSAFCLQKERTMPQDGTSYDALEPEKLTLVVKAADGSVHTLPGGGLSIESRRSQVAVEVSLPESIARELGAVELAVGVAPDLALVPAVAANDPRPFRSAEVARARDTLATADVLFARDVGRTRMARLLNRLINALPGNSGADPANAERAWQRVTGSPSHFATSDPVLSEAAQIYESCRLGLADIWPPGLRRCLEVSHDAVMGGINADFWNIVGTGS